MVTGWFVSLKGLLGQPAVPIPKPAWNYTGVILCVSCVIISSFIKNEEEEKEKTPRRVSSVGNLGSSVITEVYDPEPLIPVTDSQTSWVDNLSPVQKAILPFEINDNYR